MARIQDIFITVGILQKEDAPEILYAGLDAAKAQEIYSKAGTEFVEVGVVAHPQVVFPRRPAEEARLMKESAAAAEERVKREREHRAILADWKDTEARKLAAEADVLRQGITPSKKPVAQKSG